MTFEQTTLFGSPEETLLDLVQKYPEIELLKTERTLSREDIREFLLKRKELELKANGIERMYSEDDYVLTAEYLMNNEIRVVPFANMSVYQTEYMRASLNEAQNYPGAKPYQVWCGDVPIGILTFGVPLLRIGQRVQEQPEDMDFQQGWNIQVCVSYPWASKYLVGKLLATIGCTMGRMAGAPFVETTGLYGKAIQYDRLPFFRFMGLTKGLSGYKYILPREFFKELEHLMAIYFDIDTRSFHDKWKTLLQQFFVKTGMSKEGFQATNCLMQRSYYLCMIDESWPRYNEKWLPPATIEEAVDYWRNRWLVKRLD